MEYTTVIDQRRKEWGEDRVIIHDRFIGVVDGVTPITGYRPKGYKSIAEWMVTEFAQYVKCSNCSNYAQLCDDFIKSTKNNPIIRNADLLSIPAFTTAVISAENERIKGYILGDCSIHVQLSDGTVLNYCDDRVKVFEQKTREILQQSAAENSSKKQVFEQIKSNRLSANSQDSFWVVTYHGDFINEFVTFEFPDSKQVKSILICSDGFERLFSEPISFDIENLFSEKIDLQKAMRILRQAEAEHKSDIGLNQVKTSDDASAVLVFFDNP